MNDAEKKKFKDCHGTKMSEYIKSKQTGTKRQHQDATPSSSLPPTKKQRLNNTSPSSSQTIKIGKPATDQDAPSSSNSSKKRNNTSDKTTAAVNHKNVKKEKPSPSRKPSSSRKRRRDDQDDSKPLSNSPNKKRKITKTNASGSDSESEWTVSDEQQIPLN